MSIPLTPESWKFCRSERFGFVAVEAAHIGNNTGDADGGKGKDVRHEKIPSFGWRRYYIHKFSLPLMLLGASFTHPTLHAVPSSAREYCQVAKRAIPAVVSVRVELGQKRAGPRSEGWDEPFDPFQDDFWNRFFGTPPTPPQQKSPRLAQGSGFVVSADGNILTNHHVVQDAEGITVIFSDGREYPATLVGADPNTDVALLKIDVANVPFLTFGDSDDLEVGEKVIAVGNPLGLEASVTAGIVSAKGRNDLDIALVEEFIQTDAPINRGNSGGCLLDMDGNVVGMNTAIASNTGGSIGLGFAIPSNILKPVMYALLEHGKVVRGYLGVALQRIDNNLAQAFNLDKAGGALVAEVVPGGPADKAGLKSGDIITDINGSPVENAAKLRNMVAFLKPDESVQLTVQRKSEVVPITAIIGVHPESELAASEARASLSIIVQDLTPELANELGYANDKGVVIKYVDPSSPAYEAGLRRGQLIVSVNQMPVTTAEQFYRQVLESSQKKRILLQIKWGQTQRYVTISLQ